MTEAEEKKYLSSMNKIIKSGNPKYLSYVSKEYMRFKDANPQIALALTCMIQKEAEDKSSVYGIFLDNGGNINLDSMNDISRISNLNEFINTVESLSEQNVDFSDLTSDELIKEGESIAEDLAREAEMLEAEIDSVVVDENTDLSQSEAEVESNASDMIAKVSVFAAIGGVVAAAVSRIQNAITRIRSTISRKQVESSEIKEEKKQEENQKEEENKQVEENGKDDSFCPKVVIDPFKAVNDAKKEQEAKEKMAAERKAKGLTTDDSVDDNPADDFLDF